MWNLPTHRHTLKINRSYKGNYYSKNNDNCRTVFLALFSFRRHNCGSSTTHLTNQPLSNHSVSHIHKNRAFPCSNSVCGSGRRCTRTCSTLCLRRLSTQSLPLLFIFRLFWLWQDIKELVFTWLHVLVLNILNIISWTSGGVKRQHI